MNTHVNGQLTQQNAMGGMLVSPQNLKSHCACFGHVTLKKMLTKMHMYLSYALKLIHAVYFNAHSYKMID